MFCTEFGDEFIFEKSTFGTQQSALNREVSLVQGCPLRGVSLYDVHVNELLYHVMEVLFMKLSYLHIVYALVAQYRELIVALALISLVPRHVK